MNNLDPVLIGQVLYYRGFRDWFLYLFKHINGQPFIIEKFHEEMFAEVRNIIEGKESRVCFNIFPRSAKTTFMTWLCIYAILTNPKSQIIYTSYSQELLRQVSKNIADIMQHPIFKAMYPSLKGHQISEEEVNPMDDFWRSYVMQETGKPTFSARKITTPQGGIILFSSIGSSITGFGVSVRGAKGFTGMLCIDDPDNTTTIRSQRIRQKTQTYFAEVLLSRLNNPDAPIVLIQQRLHQDDFTAYVTKHYPFKVLKFPLLDEQGNCICLSQYTEQRIKELQVNNYVFQAQYMQSPVPLSGGVFKREWFRFYQDMEDTRYRRIFITADTACKTNEWNDFTAIGVWGLTAAGRLRLLDLVHAKLEIPELQATFLALWDKWSKGIGTCRCTGVYIEDKASGTQVIQQLRRAGGMPIMAYKPEKDKLSRALDAVPQVVAGNVELPGNEMHPLTAPFLNEILSFTADGSAIHDDLTDCFTAAIKEAYDQRGYF